MKNFFSVCHNPIRSRKVSPQPSNSGDQRDLQLKYSCRSQDLDIKKKKKKYCKTSLQDSLILWSIVEIGHKDNAHPFKVSGEDCTQFLDAHLIRSGLSVHRYDD